MPPPASTVDVRGPRLEARRPGSPSMRHTRSSVTAAIIGSALVSLFLIWLVAVLIDLNG